MKIEVVLFSSMRRAAMTLSLVLMSKVTNEMKVEGYGL
jgi:hypothetical protein